ncbi:MAG TPA: TolC family protein, partial [Saprospiraceae bacterium]|nr:TolC family protein [Saprospiraceae bacterium]
RIAQLNVKDAEWQIQENKATALPHLNLGLNYSYFIQQPEIPAIAYGFGDDPDQRLTFALRNNLAGKISVNQLLFNNSYLVGMKAARMYRDYVNLQLEAVKEKLRQNVRDAYLPALLLTESVAVLDSNIANQESLLNETKAIYKAGFVEQLDVDRLDLISSTLRTERESLLRQRDILIDVFKFAINMSVKDEVTLSDDLSTLLDTYADINVEEELDYNSRPDYVTLQKLKELNNINVELYDKDWLPTVSLFASYDPSFQGNDKLYWIPSAVAGVSVSMPIYDGGLSRAKQERAIIAAMQVNEQSDMLIKAFDLEIQNARNQYKNAIQKVKDQERNLALAQRIHNTSQIKFKAGIGSSFEVTQAQTALYQSQGLLVQARYELLHAIVALNKALGK